MLEPDSAWGTEDVAIGKSSASRALRWPAPIGEAGNGLAASPSNGMERRAVHAGEHGAVARPSGRPGTAEALVWSAALLFAFLPVLQDLLRHLLMSAWARYALLFPLLFVRCARREAGRALPARRDAPLWIVAGLVIAAVALFLGHIRWGRLGLLLAGIGLCRRFGWGSWRAQLLLVFAIPVPTEVLRFAQPLAEPLSRLAAALVAPLGADVEPLWLGRYGSGLVLAPLLAGLGWYAAVLRDLPLRAGVRISAGAGVLAVPLQLLALAGAAVAALFVGHDLARAALVNGPPIVAAAAGLVLAERGAQARA